MSLGGRTLSLGSSTRIQASRRVDKSLRKRRANSVTDVSRILITSRTMKLMNLTTGLQQSSNHHWQSTLGDDVQPRLWNTYSRPATVPNI